MCTYLTEKMDVEGSGKGAAGWFTLSQASVYFDHPQHAPAEHTLNIDFLNPRPGAVGPGRGGADRASRPAPWPRPSSRRWPPRRRAWSEPAGRRAARGSRLPVGRSAECRWAVPGSG